MGYKELEPEVNQQEARARDWRGVVGASRAGACKVVRVATHRRARDAPSRKTTLTQNALVCFHLDFPHSLRHDP